MDVNAIAKLARIPVTPHEEKTLAEGFKKVLSVLDELKRVDVVGVEATSQVTGLENVFRDDEIDVTRMFTQDKALANAPRKYNGFFVVDQVLDQE